MDRTNTFKILVQNPAKQDGEALLRIQAGAAIALDQCFSGVGVSVREMPEVEFDGNDSSVAWIKTDIARECLSEGLITHSGLRQAIYAALRSCGHKITIVKDVTIQVPDSGVCIAHCHVATNLDAPGMEYVCLLEGEVTANLYCGNDHIPDVPIFFISTAYAQTKDWLADGLRNNVRIGGAQEQGGNKILSRWGGGEWTYLDENLLPFAEHFPWPLFDKHLKDRGKLKLDKSHFVQAIKDALYERADSEMEKRYEAARQAKSGSIHDIPWRQYFVNDAIHRHPELIEKDYGNKDTTH